MIGGSNPPARPGPDRAVFGALLCLVASLAVGCARPVGEGAPDPAPATAGPAASSDDVMHRLLRSGEPGCSAAVGVEGEVVWSGARGLADLGTGRPLTTSTTFDVGSVSKQFTATSVLLLVHDAVLRLEDPVSRWVPDLPAWSEQVTLDHLIRHRSAIPEVLDLLAAAGHDIADPDDREEARAAIAAVRDLPRPAGELFAYSNSNYLLLAQIVENATRQSFPAFVRTRIFAPLDLGMEFARSGARPDTRDESSARPYTRDPGGERWEPAGSRWDVIGAGSVQTTPSELVRWADNYRTGRLGGQWLLDAQLDDGPGEPGGTAERYAAGIFVGGDGALGHDGVWAGFRTTFRVMPDRRTSVAVSCNGDGPVGTPVDEVTRELLDLWT